MTATAASDSPRGPARGAPRAHQGLRTGPAAALLVACFAASVGVQVARDRVAPRSTIDASILYVQSPAAMRRIVLGYDALAADIYWIRAIQHFGGTRRLEDASARTYHLLAPLLDLTTGLDPLFNIAYRFGAIFLSEPPPGGPGKPELAIRLLERGLEARPDNWRYMQDIGFVHYWWRRDYRAAAEWFNRGADVPGAPWWLRSVAATTLAQGGDRRASRQLWQTLAESADNDWVRRDAARRLQQLDALDARELLQRVVRQFIDAGGQKPYSWEALVRARRLRAVPRDPSGTVFYLGPWSGDVDVADESSLRPLPTDPRADVMR